MAEKCLNCGQFVSVSTMIEVDDGVFCSESCANSKGFHLCEQCGGWGDINGDGVKIDDSFFCDSDCAYECGFETCTWCGDWHDASYSEIAENGNHYCSMSCANSDDMYRCEDCGDLERSDDMTYVDDRHGFVCSSCSYSYYYCNYCDEWHDNDYVCERGRSDEPIANYSWKPEPEFKHLNFQVGAARTLPYTGYELELDRPEGFDAYENDNAAEMANSTCDGLIYCKNDCTISGFEMVSHPFTYGWFRNNKKEILDLHRELRRLGYRSFNANDAGMHVHVSMAAFKKSTHLLKFMQFFYSGENANFIKAISQRSDNSMNTWCKIDVGRKYFKEQAKRKRNVGYSSRDVAVNLTGSTAEVRLFRGTLDPIAFQKNIEFVNSLFQFSAETSLRRTHFIEYMNWIEKDDGWGNVKSFMENSDRFNRQAFNNI